MIGSSQFLCRVPRKPSSPGTAPTCMTTSLHEWSEMGEKPRWKNQGTHDSANASLPPPAYYASLGRPRTSTHRNGGGAGTPRTPRRGETEFCLQEGMQVLCTGELGKLEVILRAIAGHFLKKTFAPKIFWLFSCLQRAYWRTVSSVYIPFKW